MELRPFWRWQRAAWFLWDEFPSPVTVPALSFAFVSSSLPPGNSQFKGTTGSTCVRACVRACARRCAGSHTNAALNAGPRPRRWYHSARRMVSFAPAFSVGRTGATSLPAFVEESRDRKPGLASNPERIGSAFDTMSSAKGKLQPGTSSNGIARARERERTRRNRKHILSRYFSWSRIQFFQLHQVHQEPYFSQLPSQFPYIFVDATGKWCNTSFSLCGHAKLNAYTAGDAQAGFAGYERRRQTTTLDTLSCPAVLFISNCRQVLRPSWNSGVHHKIAKKKKKETGKTEEKEVIKSQNEQDSASPYARDYIPHFVIFVGKHCLYCTIQSWYSITATYI